MYKLYKHTNAHLFYDARPRLILTFNRLESIGAY